MGRGGHKRGVKLPHALAELVLTVERDMKPEQVCRKRAFRHWVRRPDSCSCEITPWTSPIRASGSCPKASATATTISSSVEWSAHASQTAIAEVFRTTTFAVLG